MLPLTSIISVENKISDTSQPIKKWLYQIQDQTIQAWTKQIQKQVVTNHCPKRIC